MVHQAMNTDKTLWLLDKHASEFNFPVLDNAYLEFGEAQLTAFRDDTEWLVVFDIVGFSVREAQFVNDVYAYGSCIGLGGLVGEETPFTSSPELPIFDPESNECVADWKNWAIRMHDRTLRFSPTPDEYAKAGIHIKGGPGPGTLTEPNLLRYLVFCMGQQLFVEDETLLSRLPNCRRLRKFVQTSRWQHPDIAGGEKPSENVAMRSLISALAQGDPTLFDPGRPNTNWAAWAGRTASD